MNWPGIDMNWPGPLANLQFNLNLPWDFIFCTNKFSWLILTISIYMKNIKLVRADEIWDELVKFWEINSSDGLYKKVNIWLMRIMIL